MLRIAKNLELPDEAVTQTFAILAKRGVGKTYTASVMVEEMLKNKLPVVVLDPIGVWWGLRSSADGKGPGLPIIIAGGDHSDIPITPDNGTIMANLIVDQRLSVVIDFSHFRKGEQIKFVTDFAETLYHRNRDPLHLVVDEADAFAPQRTMPNEARMLGAMEDLVRRGRARGIGVTMITQRPAVLNKNVLTQIEVLIALRMTAPLDQKAIDEWVKTHAEENQRDEFMTALPSMPIGTAWFWSPGWLDVFKKVEVRTRETLDSSSTPKVGDKRIVPTNMASVNLDKLKEQLSETIDKVEANNPRVLKNRIVLLENQIRKYEKQDRLPQVEVREVPILTDDDRQTLEFIAVDITNATSKLTEIIGKIEAAKQRPGVVGKVEHVEVDEVKRAPGLLMSSETQPSDGTLKKAERMILATLAQYGGRTVQQVAIITGYSSKGGGFRNALGSLRSKGYIEGQADLQITNAGLSALGPYDPLPTGQDLVQHWMRQLKLAERKILEVVAFKYPRRVSTDKVAEMTGYAAGGGGFRNALGKLRTLGLIEGHGEIKASDDFFKA